MHRSDSAMPCSGRVGFALALVLVLAFLIGPPHAHAQAVIVPHRTAEIHRVLVIPITIPGRSAVAVDAGQVAAALYGARESVASRYRSLSYGQLDFVGSERDVADPVTLAEPPDFCDTGLARIASAAREAVRRRGVSLQGYQHFVFVLPRDIPCSWTGFADIGGDRVWVKQPTSRALQHELGHNLGMNHAEIWPDEQPEASDFMGSGAASLNAPHVLEMGWLRAWPVKVIEVASPGDVTLEALETPPSTSLLPKVAIVRPVAGPNIYILSYRAGGPSNTLPQEFTAGLNIHVVARDRPPGRFTWFVGALTDRAVYRTDEMLVRQISHVAGDRVTFHISFGDMTAGADAEPTPAPPGSVQSLASGKCLDLPGGQTRDGTLPIQYDCHGGPNQMWSIERTDGTETRIVSRMSGTCLGIEPGPASGSARIVLLPCDGSSDRSWLLKPAGAGYLIENAGSHMCLEVPGGSPANRVRLVASTCAGSVSQLWRYGLLIAGR